MNMGIAVAAKRLTNKSSLFSYDRIRNAVGTNISSSSCSTQVLTTGKAKFHHQNCNTRKPKPQCSLPSSEVINELHRGIRRTEKSEIQTTHNPAKKPRNFIDDKLSPTKVLHAATIKCKYADQNCNTRKPKPESSLPSSEVINELHRGTRTEKSEIQTTHNSAKKPINFIDEDDDKLSPTKVLHAATIKYKYADIILKAKQQMELVNKVKEAVVDPIKAPKIEIDDDLNKTMMKARLMDLRRIDEERVKSNMQRQREAARTAMQQIKQTVFFDNGLEIESAFHALIAG